MTLAEDSRPPYVQVADTIRAQIASAEYGPGAKLPSVRDLAKTFGIAEMTVNAGLRVLREEGLITATPGRGTFVRKDAKVPAPERDVRELVDHLASQVKELTDRVAALERKSSASPAID
jgi:GntR family transcriptional regulator